MTTDTELATIEYQDPGISKASLEHTQQQLALLEELVHNVLRPNQDFGLIPGTEKPTLLKPGAANIIAGFNCHSEPQLDLVDVRPDEGYAGYTVHVDVVNNQSGKVVARGFGSCSSYEKKYRYREEQRKCPYCKQPAIIKGKEEYGGGWLCWNRKGGCGAKFSDGDPVIERQSTGLIENPDPLDQSNTYLKMAVKRAEVDAALRLPGVARFFTQDLEDIMGPGVLDPTPNATEAEAPRSTRAEPQQPSRQGQQAPAKTQLGSCPEHQKPWGVAQGGRVGHPVSGRRWCWKDEWDPSVEDDS